MLKVYDLQEKEVGHTRLEELQLKEVNMHSITCCKDWISKVCMLSMEYGNFKPYEADAFVLDHVITCKQFSKFNSRNFWWKSTSKIFSLENYLLYSIYFPSKTHYTLDHKTAMIPHILLQLPLIIEKQ